MTIGSSNAVSSGASYLPIEIANATVVTAEADSPTEQLQLTTRIALPVIVVSPPSQEQIMLQARTRKRGTLIRVAITIIALAASLAVMDVSSPPPMLTTIGALSVLLPITTHQEMPSARNLIRFALSICLIWGSIHASTQFHNRNQDVIATLFLVGPFLGALTALPRNWGDVRERPIFEER